MSATIIGQVAVEVRPDTTDFRKTAKRELTAIEKSLDKIKVEFDADTDKVARDLRDSLRKLQNKADRNPIKIKVEIESASARVTSTRLAVLGRNRSVRFAPTLDEGAAAKVATALAALSGARSVGNIGGDFMDVLQDLDKSVPKIGAWALALGNLGSFAATATSNTLALGSSLASIAPAALALPGIFGGLAIGAGATFAVFKDFNKVIPEFKSQLSSLQDEMSGTFWSKAEEPIRHFIDTIFPLFADGMKGTSSSLGGFFGGLAGSFENVFNGPLEAMFDDLNKSIDISSQYTDQFASVIQQLGSVGAGQLPRLAGWFGDITTEFDDWLKDKGPAGLQKLVDTGIEGLQDLGGIVVATSSTFAGLARAAEKAGGSSLQMVRDTMEGVADTVNSPKFQKSMTTVFEAAHEGMHELAHRTGPEFKGFMERLATTLDSVLPSAGRAAGDALGAIFGALDQPKVQDSVIGLFDSLESSISNLAPSMPAVADGLAGIADVVGSLAENVSKGLSSALDIVAPAISGLADDLDPLIDELGILFDSLINGSGPAVDTFADALGGLAGVVADVLGPVNDLIGFLDSIPGVSGTAFQDLTTIGLLVGGALWFGPAIKGKLLGFSDSMLDLATKAPRAEGALLRVGSAAEGIGSRMTGGRLALLGIGGGIEAIGSQAGESNEALGLLASVGGGALMGFAVGGPVGAAIGGAASGLLTLTTNALSSKSAAKEAAPAWANLAATLNDVTGAATEATRSMIYDDLNKAGVIKEFTDSYGISSRTVIDGVLGQKKAREQLTAAIAAERAEGQSYIDEYNAATKAASDSGTTLTATEEAYYLSLSKTGQKLIEHADNLEKEIGLQEDAVASVRAKAAAIADYDTALRGLPKDLITEVKTEGADGKIGLDGTIRQVKDLAKQFHLTPKKIRTLIEAEGIDLSQRELRKLIASITKADKTDAHPRVTLDAKDAGKKVDTIKTDVKGLNKLKGVTEVRVKDSASKPITVVQQKIQKFAAITATAHLGVQDSASSTISRVTIALNQLNGKTATTYIKTVRLGNGGGGQNSDLPGSGRVSKQVIEASAADVVDAWQKALKKQLAKATSRVDANWDALWKKFSKPEQHKKLQQMFGDDRKAMNALERQINSLQTALDNAQNNLKNLIDQQAAYKQSVIDSINATGDPVASGATTYAGIVRMMEKARDRAKQFSAVIQELIKQHLNPTTLQQLINAGPEAGLNTAQQILAGGVQGINDIQAEIQAAGESVGTATSENMFGSLIDDAETTVNSLIAKLKPLQDQLRKFAKDLIAALRDQLQKEAISMGLGNVDGGSAWHPGNTGGGGGKGGKGGSNSRVTSATPATAAAFAAASSSHSQTVVSNKTLIYNAAPGRSLDSEGDLFEAINKTGAFL